ncbi:TfuA-like protein [Streptomyces sp. NPDC088354]|uniref:TfuA-like protein n=1 Tax=Streptomyces sp. NPDC088354 TaxID=3365856 RepID=UPI0038236978
MTKLEREKVIHAYLGPSLPGADAAKIVPGLILHPPVIHGDLLIHDIAPGDVVVIVDGYYHQQTAVRHKEVLHLLKRGVMVIGASSMGALRAAELEPFGMIGCGWVFQQYRSGRIIADDAVALMHGPEPDYVPMSVPLVEIMFSTEKAVAQGLLDAEIGERACSLASNLHYTERSWRRLTDLLTQEGHRGHTGLFSKKISSPGVKGDDAVAALRLAAELRSSCSGKMAQPIQESVNQSSAHLAVWLREWKDSSGQGQRGRDKLFADWYRLTSPDAPAQWRSWVLKKLDEAPDEGAGLRQLAYAATSSETFLKSQKYLSDREIRTMTSDQLTELLLVRAFRHDHPDSTYVTYLADLVSRKYGPVSLAELANLEGGQGIFENETGIRRKWSLRRRGVDYVLHRAALDRGFDSLDDALSAQKQICQMVGPGDC